MILADLHTHTRYSHGSDTPAAMHAAAVARINTMSATELYADLTSRLPARETRFYVAKVRRMKDHYAALR